MKSEERQNASEASAVSGFGLTKQDAEIRRQKWSWVEASIWTDHMLAALENGVTGGKWFSLIDKVVRPRTLEIAWQQVARNKGAAGVEGQNQS